MQQRERAVGDLTIAYLEAGPADGPLALCLHGFPDTPWTWRHLLPELAAAGYRAVAPWLRGYAPTGMPPDGRYTISALAEDAEALHEALGADERAVVIGHDWGALAAYACVASDPARWSRMVTMAVPPMSAMAGSFLSYDQVRRSFYIYFFQTPFAEMALAGDFLDRLWADWSPGYDGSEDVARVRESIGAPERMTAAIATYRSMFQPDPRARPDSPITRPWLYLHGRDDGCIGVELAPPEAVVVDGAGHFLQVERPDVVNRAVLDFLAGETGR